MPNRTIALLLPNLGGGGAERVALTTARDLLAQGHGVDIVLVQARGELMEMLPRGARVVDLAAPRLRRALVPLVRYLRRVEPASIHAFMWPLTVIAIVASRLARSRTRIMLSEHVPPSKAARGLVARLMFKWTARMFYPRADVRVVCSAVAADDVARATGLPRSLFEVVTNPIEPPRTIAATAEAESLWSTGTPRILTVGTLKPQKNHVLLLRAFARLQEYPHARLIILGEGALRKELEAVAHELGIEERVKLPGFRVDPWPFLASADLFVLSSDFEGFPLVLAEAMHAGLRVVSTDCVSGPSELLGGGRFGRLVPCRNVDALAAAIKYALSAPHDPERVRARAIEVAGNAQIARYAELLIG